MKWDSLRTGKRFAPFNRIAIFSDGVGKLPAPSVLLGSSRTRGDGNTETKDQQAMERDILLDNFASLIVRQAIRFPLVEEHPKPPKNPNGCFRLPSKVRQAQRRSAQKKCRRQYRNDTACGIVFISPAIVHSVSFPLHAPVVQHRFGASCPHCA